MADILKNPSQHVEIVAGDDEQLSYVRTRGGPVTVLDTFGQDAEHKPKIPMSAFVIIGLVALGQLLNAYLGVAPAVAAYTIASTLGAPEKQQWIVQAQGIPSIVSGPIIAVISDVYGRKYALLGLITCGIVADIICITTSNIDVLILGQTINGVAAGVIGLLFAIPSEIVPSRYRAVVQGINTGAGFFGVFLAFMSTGSAIASDLENGWRWVWRAQLIVNAILLFGFVFTYRPPPRTESSETSLHQRVKQLDWVGYVLLTGGLVPLLMGFAWAADSNYGWSDPHAYVCVVMGFLSFIACGIYEWKGTKVGFLHHKLFNLGLNFPLAALLCAVEGDIFYLVNNIYTAEVFSIWFPTDSPLTQSACLLPFYVAVLLSTPIIMTYTTRTKDLKRPLIIAFTLQLIGVIGLGTTTATSTTRALIFNALMGFGFAALLMLLITVVQFATPPLFIGIASALAISCRTLGGTIGYGVVLVIHSNVLEQKLVPYVLAAVTPLGFEAANIPNLLEALATRNATVIGSVPGISPAIIAAAELAESNASAFAYGRAWYAAIPAVALGLAAMCFIENPEARMDYVVDAPLNKVDRHPDDKLEQDGYEMAT